MAGMLPGVESARRRRFHQSGGFSDSPNSTRRSSFCLYSSKHESPLSSASSSSSSSLQISRLYQSRVDERLGGAAKEAKERLDERLKKSPNQRQNSKEKLKRRPKALAELHMEVYGSKKLRWKASDEDDCAVCLELFKVGETLMRLPCSHKFHSSCLEPWLQNNTYCPCCRMSIISR